MMLILFDCTIVCTSLAGCLFLNVLRRMCVGHSAAFWRRPWWHLFSMATCRWVLRYASMTCTFNMKFLSPRKTKPEVTLVFWLYLSVQTLKNFNELIEQLLGLLSRDVIENVRNAATYFQVLHVYVQLVSELKP